jgi:DNA polymerase-3 subunit delta'
MARAPAVQEVEALPEPDRLDEFPHPRATRQLFGHGAAEQELAQSFASGRMHHGWLLTGREGIGKATLAYHFARHVLARPEERDNKAIKLDVPESSTAYRQVLALSHPGLLLLRRPWDFKTKKLATVITVDEVRRLRGFLAHSAAAGAWRAVIVDSADELNVNSANALLKSLEEPPPQTVFLLISSEPGRLLPTIRSRVRRLDLKPLGKADLRNAVLQAIGATDGAAPPESKAWPMLERLAEGSVRRLLMLAGAKGLELHERIMGQLSGLPRLDWALIHTLSDELAGAANETRFELFYELLLGTLSRTIRARVSGQGAPDELALAAKLMTDDAVPQWAALWERIINDKAEAMAINLDRKALILELFAALAKAAQRS